MVSVINSVKRTTAVFKVSFLLCLLSLALIVFLVDWHRQTEQDAVESALEKATQTAMDAASEITVVLERIPAIAQNLADDLLDGRLSNRRIEARLIEDLEDNPELGAITACYLPGYLPNRADPDADDLYCPFSYTNENGDTNIERVEAFYDYTKPDGAIGANGIPIRSAWYHRPLDEGPVWGEPYLGSGTGVYWVVNEHAII